jgi:hypothetical protein
MIVKAQQLFTTVAPNPNQGVNRKPGCTLVFGVLFVSFWTSKKIKEKELNQQQDVESLLRTSIAIQTHNL